MSPRKQGGSAAEEPEGQRLQKVLAQAGLASRRASEIMIDQGRVKVNGRVVSEQGRRVNPDRRDPGRRLAHPAAPPAAAIRAASSSCCGDPTAIRRKRASESRPNATAAASAAGLRSIPIGGMCCTNSSAANRTRSAASSASSPPTIAIRSPGCATSATG